MMECEAKNQQQIEQRRHIIIHGTVEEYLILLMALMIRLL